MLGNYIFDDHFCGQCKVINLEYCMSQGWEGKYDDVQNSKSLSYGLLLHNTMLATLLMNALLEY